MKGTAIGAIIMAAVAALAPVRADTNAPIRDWSIETVVVTAKPLGPALWHVVSGESEVWILGTVEPIPSDLKWDTRELAHVLDRSRALLLPPRGRVGVFEGIWFLLTNGDVLRLPDGHKLEASLTEPLRGRFVQARSTSHRDADRYAEYKPSVAGFMLEGDYLKANNLSMTQPTATLEWLASQKAVPVRRVATYPALDVVKEVPSLSPEENRKCLADSLDDIDVMSTHARLAANAWATGDLDAIKAHYSEPKALDCLGQSASFTRLWQRSVADTVGAVDDALKHRGKTVIVINIGEFLRKNGVLERLKAQGLQVDGPGS